MANIARPKTGPLSEIMILGRPAKNRKERRAVQFGRSNPQHAHNWRRSDTDESRGLHAFVCIHKGCSKVRVLTFEDHLAAAQAAHRPEMQPEEAIRFIDRYAEVSHGRSVLVDFSPR